MSDEKPVVTTSRLSGWVKAGATSVVGLLSGAVLMYATALVNNVIQPGKPVPNLAVQVTGSLVNLNNRSTGGTQGWWDFGDGSALEPFDPKQSNVQHTYAKPGTYSVKLSLQNLVGEDTDRTVSVVVENTAPPQPEIVHFDITPVTPGDRAPAVYRLVSKTKNANFCILSAGDERPIEIIEDTASQDRYIIFNDMGSFTIRLAAVNGKQVVEKTKTVYISPNEGQQPLAKLHAEYTVVKVTRPTRNWYLACDWQGGSDDTVAAFRKESPLVKGCQIEDAVLLNKPDASAPVRNVKIEISPDKSKVVVTGELVKPKKWLASSSPPPVWHAQIRAQVVCRSSPQKLKCSDMVMALAMNSTTKVPMQPLQEGWEIVNKKVGLELWDGSRKAWEGSDGVTNARLSLMNQPCIVTAMPHADGFVVKIDCPSAPPAKTCQPCAPTSTSPRKPSAGGETCRRFA